MIQSLSWNLKKLWKYHQIDGKIKDIKVKEGDSVRENSFRVIEVEDNDETVQEKEEIKPSSTETSPIEDISQALEKLQ